MGCSAPFFPTFMLLTGRLLSSQIDVCFCGKREFTTKRKYKGSRQILTPEYWIIWPLMWHILTANWSRCHRRFTPYYFRFRGQGGRIYKSKDQRRLDFLKDRLVKVSLNFSLIFSRSNLSHNMPVVLKICVGLRCYTRPNSSLNHILPTPRHGQYLTRARSHITWIVWASVKESTLHSPRQ